MIKDIVLKSAIDRLEQSLPREMGCRDHQDILTAAEKCLEDYAKYRLDQFISEHFPYEEGEVYLGIKIKNIEVPHETVTGTLSPECNITFNYVEEGLSAEEKLIKKLSDQFDKQREEQIAQIKAWLRD